MRGLKNGPQSGSAVHSLVFLGQPKSLACPLLSTLFWPRSKLYRGGLSRLPVGRSGFLSSPHGKWGETLQDPNESPGAFTLPCDSWERALGTDGMGIWLTAFEARERATEGGGWV